MMYIINKKLKMYLTVQMTKMNIHMIVLTKKIFVTQLGMYQQSGTMNMITLDMIGKARRFSNTKRMMNWITF